MDSLTHVVMGAALQGTLMGRWQGRKAMLYGAALATLPDLDVFASYPDPVSSLTHHRGYSHSVFVLTALALVMAWLIRKRWPAAPYGPGRLLLTIWLVLITHPLLDALTTYGTQLFWPLPYSPVSISSIYIVDPVFTLPLLAAFIGCLWKGAEHSRLRAGALIFCAFYLACTLVAKQGAERRVRRALAQQGTHVEAIFSAPMPLNSLLWRVIARVPGGDYYEAVTGVLDRAPPELLRQPLHTELGAALDGDPLVARFNWFTRGWLRYDAVGRDLVVTDLRMGMPGYFLFRYEMGRQDASGRWVSVTPTRWASERGGWPELKQVLRRVVDQQPPLPLAAWAQRNNAAQ
ncbi:metal-dependent hydrolase [Bordetella sp. N]|uniref:metal-dependent hydrolase n=1 Tax=Bordetella sp. N TaxID=1746199 RepID=UPI0007099B41|nr:metal-dependent hydrolase [Bordetella sp. N]ALM82176.1 hydrolase [Bordetella sp. N]